MKSGIAAASKAASVRNCRFEITFGYESPAAGVMKANKLRLGYTNEYICFEDINNKELIKDRDIKCSFCRKKIRNGDWISIIHNPGDAGKPRRLHFFCLGRKCHFDWGLQGQKQREG